MSHHDSFTLGNYGDMIPIDRRLVKRIANAATVIPIPGKLCPFVEKNGAGYTQRDADTAAARIYLDAFWPSSFALP
jgi:hypothetical protein